MADAAFWVALVTGALAACVALYGRYRTLPALFIGPKTCRLEAGGCEALFRAPEAALLGVPNSALGLACYALLATGRLGGWPVEALLAGATLAVAMSVRLAWILLSRGLECRVCWAGHTANVVLWAALAIVSSGG